MRVLVTGANGFIGRHLISYLAKCGHSVIAVSRRPLCPDLNIIPFASPLAGELTKWRLRLQQVDAVVHLAGIAHRRSGALAKEYENSLNNVNVEGTAQLYRLACEGGVGNFIFLSSVAALTSRSVGRLSDTSLNSPSSLYGKSKLGAENRIRAIGAQGGCHYTILRPPVVYGRDNPANMERLISLIKGGKPLPFRSITNRRSFIYVGNLCDIIHRCLHSKASDKQTWLVSDDQDLSTPELIRKLCTAGNFPCKLIPFPRRILEWGAQLYPDSALAKIVGSLYLDIEPLKRSLGWRPLFDVDEGLRHTLS